MTVDESDGVPVARIVCTSIGQRESTVLSDEFTGLGERSGWRFVVDLSDVTVITSIGLGVLITLQKNASANKGRVALFGLGSELRQLMKMTKLDRMLTVTKDGPSAIAKIT